MQVFFDAGFGEENARVSVSPSQVGSKEGPLMTIADELVALANDYVSGRVTLADVGGWLNDRLTAYADMSDDDAAAGLWGFIQVRVWEHDNGSLPEAELRTQIRDYLSSEGLLTSTGERRAV